MINKTQCNEQPGADTSPPLLLTSTVPVTRTQRQKPGSIELTARQSEVLAFVRNFVRTNGYAPSRTDLKMALNSVSQASADGLLQRIARRGWLTLSPRLERAIVLTREGAPLYEPGDFSTTTTQVRNRDERAREPDWIDCEQLWRLFGAMPDLCLRIRSDAMECAGLSDGGIVALRLVNHGEEHAPIADGDVVAARVRDDVVLRRYHRIDDRTAELRPESTSPEHQVLCVDAESNAVEILGVVIGRMLAGAG